MMICHNHIRLWTKIICHNHILSGITLSYTIKAGKSVSSLCYNNACTSCDKLFSI